MKSALGPEYYTSAEVFRDEQRGLFDGEWHLAGTLEDFAEVNDFICISIAGRELFVQRFPEGLRAFSNVCLHRYARLRTADRGNGAVVCPYHGWAYDSTGVPVQLARTMGRAGATCSNGQKTSLDPWQTDIVGPLVFVRRNHGRGGLLNELQEDGAPLLELIGHLGTRHSVTEFVFEANWKIVVENTLESYHVNSVHPETFATVGASGQQFEFFGPHSGWMAPINKQTPRQRRIHELLSGRSLIFEGYRHFSLFPFVTVATTGGLNFSVQAILPLAPSRTLFRTYVFGPKLQVNDSTSNQLVGVLCASATEFNRKVFEEDLRICEEVQKGSAQHSSQGFLMPIEERVAHFQRAYRERLAPQMEGVVPAE